jgi:hypothetical protein
VATNTAPSPINIVRNRTTDDVEALPTRKIEEFLAQHQGDVDLATYEACLYLGRAQEYQSVTRGGISVSGPTWQARAEFWLARGTQALQETQDEDAIRMGKMTRKDIYPTAETPEYGTPTTIMGVPPGIFS